MPSRKNLLFIVILSVVSLITVASLYYSINIFKTETIESAAEVSIIQPDSVFDLGKDYDIGKAVEDYKNKPQDETFGTIYINSIVNAQPLIVSGMFSWPPSLVQDNVSEVNVDCGGLVYFDSSNDPILMQHAISKGLTSLEEVYDTQYTLDNRDLTELLSGGDVSLTGLCSDLRCSSLAERCVISKQ